MEDDRIEPNLTGSVWWEAAKGVASLPDCYEQIVDAHTKASGDARVTVQSETYMMWSVICRASLKRNANGRHPSRVRFSHGFENMPNSRKRSSP